LLPFSLPKRIDPFAWFSLFLGKFFFVRKKLHLVAIL
jgi:hypothetical protein